MSTLHIPDRPLPIITLPALLDILSPAIDGTDSLRPLPALSHADIQTLDSMHTPADRTTPFDTEYGQDDNCETTTNHLTTRALHPAIFPAPARSLYSPLRHMVQSRNVALRGDVPLEVTGVRLHPNDFAACTVPFDDDEDEVCPICQLEYEGGIALRAGDMCMRLDACGHLLHGDCLGGLLNFGTQGEWVTCPVCRGKVCRARAARGVVGGCDGLEYEGEDEDDGDDVASEGSSVAYAGRDGEEGLYGGGEDEDGDDEWGYDNDVWENGY